MQPVGAKIDLVWSTWELFLVFLSPKWSVTCSLSYVEATAARETGSLVAMSYLLGKHGNRSPIFQKAHKKLFSALPILFTQKSVDSVVVVGVASDS